MEQQHFLYEKLFSLIITVSHTISSCSIRSRTDEFKFVFMTDIHLTQYRNAVPGHIQAINTINKLQADFVITGGDLIMDALDQRYSSGNMSIMDVKQKTDNE